MYDEKFVLYINYEFIYFFVCKMNKIIIKF